MFEAIAIGFLALVLVAALVILVLFYTDRLPLPRPSREPTEFEKASQELSDNINAVGREIGSAMEPALRRMCEALNEFGKKMGR